VVEVLPNGAEMTLVAADGLHAELAGAFLRTLPALTSLVLLGFAAGALVRNGVAALGLGLGCVLAVDLARAPLRGLGLSAWLPSVYIPSPFGDESVVATYLDQSRGFANASEAAGWPFAVPLPWIVGSLVLALLVFRRRAVP
jgi:hypothetical protein